ncbi:zf-HC2 domain-containing protein [Promicromonospora sp. NPDC060204]|uniref:zf-HC2 domain-containing protein n=1 Tax=Promicromonospora sp. NPDC060204 TaxID=3347071 RepID=UPI0036536B9F
MTSISAVRFDQNVRFDQQECRSTRAAIPGYLDRRLEPRSLRRFETHIDRCPGCIRAFIDVRQVAWARRNADARRLDRVG